MDHDLNLCICICTRNRENELIRSVQSVVAAVSEIPEDKVILLVINDGYIFGNTEEILREITQKCGNLCLIQIDKVKNPGLFNSRLLAIRECNCEWLLFIDDDVELTKDYLLEFKKTVYSNPQISGVGGIDIFLKPKRLKRQIYELIFFLRSPKPGKLSLSGHGASKIDWGVQQRIFETEFLSGCNMAFKCEALQIASPQFWLQNYSLGEDVFLSFLARQSGPLLINPALRVYHYQSQISRDHEQDFGYAQIMNHYYLLREVKEPNYRKLCLVWSSIGLILRYFKNWFFAQDLVCKRQMHDRLLGSLIGLRDFLRESIKNSFL